MGVGLLAKRSAGLFVFVAFCVVALLAFYAAVRPAAPAMDETRPSRGSDQRWGRRTMVVSSSQHAFHRRWRLLARDQFPPRADELVRLLVYYK